MEFAIGWKWIQINKHIWVWDFFCTVICTPFLNLFLFIATNQLSKVSESVWRFCIWGIDWQSFKPHWCLLRAERQVWYGSVGNFLSCSASLWKRKLKHEEWKSNEVKHHARWFVLWVTGARSFHAFVLRHNYVNFTVT